MSPRRGWPSRWPPPVLDASLSFPNHVSVIRIFHDWSSSVLQPPRLQVKPLSGFVSVPEDQVLDTPTVDDPDRMSDLTSTMTSSRDEDTSRGGEDTSRGEEPAEWTARATAWLKPLQLMFASNQSEDAADSTASTAEVKQIV